MIDFSESRWAKPHVAKVVDMAVTPAGEVLTCECLVGNQYALNLSGTKLHGFVTEYIGTALEVKPLPIWVEFGMSSPFVPYIEPLFTSSEFDRLPRNLRLRAFESVDGYQQIKRTHLVPLSIYDREDLYYEKLC